MQNSVSPEINAIPAFDDNYIWLITEPGKKACAVVDPGDEEPVLAKLAEMDLELSAILITHKHYDHVGGVAGLKAKFPDAIVFGPGNEGIKGIDAIVSESDRVELPGMQSVFEVLSVPGHTEGHIAYYGHASLFCGDTLFLGGCGRVFTGTFEQLSASLQVISKLPENTKIYCAHEYTLANLGFGLWVEPENEALKQRHEAVSQARQNNIATVPGVLSDELQTNPFLRTDKSNVIMAAEKWAAENWPGKNLIGKKLKSQADVFTALRQWKDQDYD